MRGGKAYAGAYRKGRLAALAGQPVSACPYSEAQRVSPASAFARHWKAGHAAGERAQVAPEAAPPEAAPPNPRTEDPQMIGTDQLPHIVEIQGDRPEFPKLHTRTDHLECELTDAERMEKARELAKVTNDIAAETDRQKAIKQSLAARMGELQARQSQLAITVDRGVELRGVEVVILANYDGGVAHEVRTDVGLVIRTRPLEDHERQPLLEDVPAVEVDEATVQFGDGPKVPLSTVEKTVRELQKA